MKNKFIKTLDNTTADKLSKLGFQKVSDSGGTYLFINNNTLKFSDEIDVSKITYTNILCI